MNCDELEPLLAPYVDDEAPLDDRERVAGHLDRCRPCAIRAAGERAVRRLVQLRGRALTQPAPPALRARCQALVQPAPAGWFSWSGLRLAAAATAGVFLLVGVIGYGVVTHSATLLVAGLTLDHLKCFAMSGGASSQDSDPRAIEARLERDYGWRLGIPGGARAPRLALVGARRCLSSDGTVAHVLYRHDGKPVSLFVLPDSVHRSASLSFAGFPARIWSRGGTTFILVASESDARIQPVAQYFQAAAY